MNPSMSRSTRGALRLAGVLVVIAVAGLMWGCGCGSAPSASGPASAPAPVQTLTGDELAATGTGPAKRGVTPIEFQPVTDADVAEARSRLAASGVTSAELAEACGYYADNGWAYAEARNAARSVGPRRVAEVVTEVSAVAENIAMPREWVSSVAEGIDRPAAEWTEAERDVYGRAVMVRKRTLIEPLCAP